MATIQAETRRWYTTRRETPYVQSARPGATPVTATITRLIMTMLMLPATGAVFLLTMLAVVHPPGPPGVTSLLLVWGIVYVFVAVYWLVLWGSMVRWTQRRAWGTVAASAASVLLGGFIGSLCFALARWMPVQFPVLIGGGTVPIIWVLATVMLWRETTPERALRLAVLGASVTCPLCGYNLAGLREAACPECGGAFTLDQLAAAQPRGISE